MFLAGLLYAQRLALTEATNAPFAQNIYHRTPRDCSIIQISMMLIKK